jgi:hypothetical protein
MADEAAELRIIDPRRAAHGGRARSAMKVAPES